MSINHTEKTVDLLIIGGGINGAAIAADAAGRGLSVVLCEQGDLACGTSSASSQLIHGGLRYLEYGDFRLVRKSLKERAILQKKAPHLIKPARFIMPHHPKLRSAWLIRLGLFLYDHIGGKNVFGKSKKIYLKNTLEGDPLKSDFKTGFSTIDCIGNDARLVVLNAMVAAQHGAQILTRHKLVSAKRNKDHWQATLSHQQQSISITAKMIINAAGPWVEDVLEKLNCRSDLKIRLVQGCHLITPKLYEGDHAYILQNEDRRIVFILPYANKFHCIGTTEVDYKGDPGQVKTTATEIDYLCDCINQHFKQKLTPDQIISNYAGVRLLTQSDPQKSSAISRDYTLEINQDKHSALLLSVFGGKITNHRQLAEQALAKIKPFFPHCGNAWTAHTPLPGGDIKDMTTFIDEMQCAYPWLEATLLQRYCHTYGTLTKTLLANTNNRQDLGQHFGADLYQKEVDYLIRHEWAQTSADILWRRTKLGLVFTAEAITQLDNWLADNS
ncbi:MAG: glycerol-3-phosphate dehydrogenase [Gammaproteobacteria bacterium]